MQDSGPEEKSQWPDAKVQHTLRSWLISLGLLAVLILAIFGNVLFTAKDTVLSSSGKDLALQFIHWRAFGFGELRHGNLALWNPHLFSGTPYFGGFQSALLYPPNALFLFLPLAKAINWSIALHVFLAGAFTYAWTARRGLMPAACFLSAVIFMFCGAYFSHIYPGHLTNLCAMVWSPLLFVAIDGLFGKPSLGWSLMGMFAVAMQVLAGHPQYVFYTAVGAAIYCALCLFKVREQRRFMLGLAGIVGGGVALSAVQLFTGLQESREMVRSGGLPYDMAAIFSFPPEDFLMLLSPHIFGDMKTVLWWGRCYPWEVGLFIGVSGFVLAIMGAIWGEKKVRRFSIVMVGLMLLLALGSRTPLFKLLYYGVPGFDQFRGNAKFIFLASLFLAMLAGVGFDELVKGRHLSGLFLAVIGSAGILLLVAALWTRPSGAEPMSTNRWHPLMLAFRGSGETYAFDQFYDDPAFVLQAGRVASQSLFISGLTLVGLAFLLFLAARFRPVVWVVLVLAVVELFVFAMKSLDHFDLAQAANTELGNYLKRCPGDYRILHMQMACANAALSLGVREMWGYDPGVLLRYAQLLAATQKINPNDAAGLSSELMPLSQEHPLFDMFRLRFTIVPQDDKTFVYERTNFLPHVLLVSRCQVLKGRDEILSALMNPAFNPREEVVLETEPNPKPKPTTDAGNARLLDESTDSLTIEAEVKSPCILLVTDTYAKGWRARALPGSGQLYYQVMPANYCLRAVPLTAGHHLLRLEYAPFGFRVGRWVSIASLGAFLVLVVARHPFGIKSEKAAKNF